MRPLCTSIMKIREWRNLQKKSITFSKFGEKGMLKLIITDFSPASPTTMKIDILILYLQQTYLETVYRRRDKNNLD